MFLGKFSESDQANFGDKLPKFTEDEWEIVSQPLDFYGFNVYQAGGNSMPPDPNSYDRYAYQGSPRTSMNWNMTGYLQNLDLRKMIRKGKLIHFQEEKRRG